MNHADKKPPAARIVELDNPALPIACPHPEVAAVFSHPRVWLQPDADGLCRCPWCGTLYLVRSLAV